MKQLESPLPIFRLQVAELKARLIGGAPQVWTRIVLSTEENMTVADTSFTALSEKSWELLRQLSQSIEEDYEKTLKHPDFAQWQDDQQTTKESGINFEDENPWGM